MQVPALAHQGDHRCASLQQSLQVGIILRPGTLFHGRAKSGQLGMAQLDLLSTAEESGILGVRSGPTSLDIMNAKLVQSLGNLQLVVDGVRDPLALSAISQGCIIQVNISHLGLTSLS